MSLLLSRRLLMVLLAALPLAAQSAAELDSNDVKRVASHLACQCGSCKSSTACEMPGGCGFCKRVKSKIANMQKVGASDKQIIDEVVRENGPQMFLAEPGTWGYAVPFLITALGLGVIYWFVKTSRKTHSNIAAEGPAVESEVFDRYHARIEKDLEKLE